MMDIETKFLYDSWYVAGWSYDFEHSLTPLTILDEQLVIFRTDKGVAVALEDACPHRKLPLSHGRLHADRVECGYHGLTFDCSGRCVHAPTQQESPPNVGVKSYPVVDRYGLLWIWMGAPDAANADDIYHIENYDNPAWGKTAGGSMDIACHYLYVIDNLLDPSHVAWVHVSSFAGAGTEDVPLNVERLEDGVLVSRWMQDRQPPPYYAPMLSFEGNCDRKQHYECRVPSIGVNKSIFTPVGKGGDDNALPDSSFINISYNFMTPVDADNTRYFWFQHRNGDPDNEALSAQMFEAAKIAFIEDRDILVEVHKGMKNKRTRNINLGIDAGSMRFRKMIEKRIAEAAGAV
jgi:vanillate O-demethylase monooxygenase subunit